MVAKEMGAVSPDNLRKNVPAELQALNQWVLIRIEEDKGKTEEGKGKYKKVPYQVAQRYFNAKSTDPSTWGSFEDAVKTMEESEGLFVTVGFVLTEADPYTFIDLDHVLDPSGNTIPEASRILESFKSYSETSLSGTGIHILIRGKKPGVRCKKDFLEIYETGKVASLTGSLLSPETNTIRDAQAELDQLYIGYFPELEKVEAQGSQIEARERSDQEVIDLARTGKSKEKFLRLWAGDKTDYKNDHSSADLGLCCILASLTKNPEQIDRVFRQSQLFRTKWESKRGEGTYGSQTIQKSLEFIGPSFLPVVVTNGKQERQLTHDVLNVMRGPTCEKLYSRGGKLCEVHYDLDEKSPVIKEQNEESLLGKLNESADWVSRDADGNDRPSKLSKRVISIILASKDKNEFPSLKGLATAPFLRADGTICEDHGYDPQSGKFLWIKGQKEFKHVSDNPTQAEIDKARNLIEETICDYPMDQASKANALGYFVTQSVMDVIEAETPIALIDSSVHGGGKTLLCKCCGLIYSGTQPDLTTPQVREEEWKKTILSLLIKGRPFIVFDNAERHIDSESLHSTLTSTKVGGRILGASDYQVYPNKSVWALAGNNLSISPDLSRRGYWIRIEPTTSKPHTRIDFKHPDLLGWISENRSELLWAILTLGRAWFSAGCPKPSVQVLGGFEDWSAVVGGILEHAGVQGFLSNSAGLWEEANTESSEWEIFVIRLYSEKGTNPMTTSEIYEMITNNPEIFDSELPTPVASAISGQKEGTGVNKLGKALRKIKDRRFGDAGLYLTRGPRTSGTNPWCLKVDHPELLQIDAPQPQIKPPSAASLNPEAIRALGNDSFLDTNTE
jgi:hypothetical protein